MNGKMLGAMLPGDSTVKMGQFDIPKPGYRQVLEVFADAIQSEPERAVTNSWGVKISDGNIAPQT